MEHTFQKRGTGERNIQGGIAGRNARDASTLGADLKEKVILLGRQDGLRWPDESEHCRELKEMNFHFAHRSSSPIWPATQSGVISSRQRDLA